MYVSQPPARGGRTINPALRRSCASSGEQSQRNRGSLQRERDVGGEGEISLSSPFTGGQPGAARALPQRGAHGAQLPRARPGHVRREELGKRVWGSCSKPRCSPSPSELPMSSDLHQKPFLTSPLRGGGHRAAAVVLSLW